MLKANDSKNIQVAYSDSSDIKKHPKKLIEVLESEHPKYEDGIPEWFNINYEDVDGNEMYQTFQCNEFGKVRYYSLVSTRQVV